MLSSRERQAIQWRKRLLQLQSIATRVRLLEQLREIDEKPLALIGKPWTPYQQLIQKSFTLQAHAFEALSNVSDGRVYAYEDESFSLDADTGKSTGKRRYIVMNDASFWELYAQLDRRHFYEVICENQPCHLYLDMEYEREYNQELCTDNELTHHLYSSLERELIKFLEANGHPLQQIKVIQLDSSSPLKFSQHWIVHIEGFAWSNQFDCGRFVTQWMTHLEKDDSVKVKDAHGATRLPIDESVYSRNRNFRLALSSKLGKCFILKPVEQVNQDFNWFCSTLAGIVNNTWPLLSMPELPKITKLTCQELSIVPHQSTLSLPPLSFVPVPESLKLLDQFFSKMIQPAQLKIPQPPFQRSSDGSLIRHYVTNSHDCEIAGRHHRHNHVHIRVNLTTMDWCQWCLAPNCASSRRDQGPQWKPFPFELVALFRKDPLESITEEEYQCLVGEFCLEQC